MKVTEIPAFIFRKTKVSLLHRSLDAYSMRQKSIADNIANADTPGFRRSEVTFEDDLKKALQKKGVKGLQSDDRHMEIGRVDVEKVRPKYVIPKDSALASGKNNVNVDQEMANLAKNQINTRAGQLFMRREFEGLKSAIRGERVR